MGKSVLKDVQQISEKRVKKKPLQTIPLQSVTEKVNTKKSGSLNEDCKVIPRQKRQTKAQKAVIGTEKENTPILLRRSKRKVNPLDEKSNDELPTKPKTVKSNSKKVQSHGVKQKSSKEHDIPALKRKVDVHQIKCTVSSPGDSGKQDVSGINNCDKSTLIASPSEVSIDSGFDCSSRVSDQSVFQRTVIVHSPDTRISPSVYNTSDLVCESPSINYWVDLAEQRRIALEEALLENELLHDQLCVLQAENSQLKEIVNLSEKLAGLIREEIQ